MCAASCFDAARALRLRRSRLCTKTARGIIGAIAWEEARTEAGFSCHGLSWFAVQLNAALRLQTSALAGSGGEVLG